MFELAKHLQQQGQIAVIPTDTVYGVVARAVDSQAVKRLYTLKRRETKPGTLVAANIDQLADLGIERNDLLGTDAFWPGAVSIITACGQNLNYLHQGVGSLAVRIPDDPWLLELLQQTGPLLTSSANQPGEPPAKTVDEARDYFGDQVSWYQDGGVVNREPSTVIRITNNNIEIIRLGVVKISDSDNKLYPRFDS
jgi:L-threonylcarbamoyladenylate synthase